MYKRTSSRSFPLIKDPATFIRKRVIHRVRNIAPQLMAEMFLSTHGQIYPFRSLLHILEMVLIQQKIDPQPIITIEDCGLVVSWILGSVCRMNRRIHPNHMAWLSKPPVFGCCQGHAPSLTIEQYVYRWSVYANKSPEILISAVIYLDRFLSRNPTFIVTEFSIHRLFVGAIIASIKFNDDHYHTNKYYASIAGISVDEMNAIEYVFDDHINFELFVDFTLYEKYQKLISLLVSFYKLNHRSSAGLVPS